MAKVPPPPEPAWINTFLSFKLYAKYIIEIGDSLLQNETILYEKIKTIFIINYDIFFRK